MKNFLLICLIIPLLASPSFALKRSKGLTYLPENFGELKFRDVPDSHWAAKSVYNLVRLGVTQGYPDGTFRGTKNITRFETSFFLSKLAESLGQAQIEKLSAELKSEFQDIKYELKRKESNISFSGTYETNYYIGNIFSGVNSQTGVKSPKGPILNYRLRNTVVANLDDSSKIKINFDSLDAGFYGGSENLLTSLFDIEGTIKLEGNVPLDIITTFGSGPKRHLFNNPIAPSENNRTYFRPYSGIKTEARIPRLRIGLSYLAHEIKDSSSGSPGTASVNQAGAYLALKFPKMFILGNTDIKISGDYFKSTILSASNFKPNLSFSFNPIGKFTLVSEIKISTLTNGFDKKKAAFIQDISWNDVNSNASVKAVVVGDDYIFLEGGQDVLDQWAYIGFDPFDRPYTNGSNALELKFGFPVSDDLLFNFKGVANLSADYKFGKGHTGSRATVESGLRYSLNKQVDLNLSYRYENDPNAAVTANDLLISGFSFSY